MHNNNKKKCERETLHYHANASEDLDGLRRQTYLSVITVQQLAGNAGLRGRITLKAKQNSGVAERFEFIHPHRKSLLWSLLFEQLNPTDQSLKWRRKRETDHHLVLRASTICEKKYGLSIPNIQISAIRALNAACSQVGKKINRTFPHTNIQMLLWIQFATIYTVSSYVSTVSRGKSKLLVCGVEMVINPEHTHKKVQKFYWWHCSILQ